MRCASPAPQSRFASFVRRLALAIGAATALCAIASCAVSGRAALETYASLRPARKPVGPLPDGFETASFRTIDGLLLRGWYAPSRNGAAIVFGHGWSGNREDCLPEAKALVAHGFGALVFDWRAHGESEGDETTWGDREQIDLEAAIDWIGARPDGRDVRLGGLAFSMGGMALVEVASRDARIGALVLEGAETSLDDEMHAFVGHRGPLFNIPTRSVERLNGIHASHVRPIDHLAALAPRPVLFIYGQEEDAALAQRMLDQASAPKELWIVPHADHGKYAANEPDELARRIVQHFTRALLDGR